MPKVTIAIPVYNEKRFLAKTIESAHGQSFKDIELLIMDNCSTDGSYRIAMDYAEHDRRIRVVRHPNNIGQAENFRSGVDLAKSPYFVWLGAHDLFNPDYIELAVSVLDRCADVVMVYPREAIFIDENNIKYGDEKACSDIDTNDICNPMERIFHIVKSLHWCTNIHGVFRTSIAKQLPFEKVIGPDNLQIALTGIYGKIHAIPIEGIRRRESFGLSLAAKLFIDGRQAVFLTTVTMLQTKN